MSLNLEAQKMLIINIQFLLDSLKYKCMNKQTVHGNSGNDQQDQS